MTLNDLHYLVAGLNVLSSVSHLLKVEPYVIERTHPTDRTKVRLIVMSEKYLPSAILKAVIDITGWSLVSGELVFTPEKQPNPLYAPS